MIGVSLLAVSTIPMRKIHTFAISQNMVVPLLALLAIGVAASILYGYVVILLIILAYVIHIPFAVRTTRLAVEAPRGVGRQAQGATPGAAGDPPGPAARTPPVDGPARATQTAGPLT